MIGELIDKIPMGIRVVFCIPRCPDHLVAVHRHPRLPGAQG